MNQTQQKIQVGQRVHCILGGGKDGTVVHIDGEQNPDGCESLGGGAIVMGGNAYFDIVWDNGTESRKVPEAIIRGVQWRIYDEIATQDDIAAAFNRVEREKARKEEDAEAEAETIDNERARLLSAPEYAKLERREGSKKSDHALAAANIRRELKTAFPGYRIKVRSRTFSMGDAVDAYVLGVQPECVDSVLKTAREIVSKYQEGNFDGMEDLYTYTRGVGRVFSALFGGSKYVHANVRTPDQIEW